MSPKLANIKHDLTVFDSIVRHPCLITLCGHDRLGLVPKSREHSLDGRLAGFDTHDSVDVGLSDVLVHSQAMFDQQRKGDSFEVLRKKDGSHDVV